MGMIMIDDNAVSVLDDVKREMQEKGIKADYSEAIRYLRQRMNTNVEVR